jgi:hypothetical protein
MKVIAEVKEKNGKAISQSIFNVVLEKDDNTNIGSEKIGSTLITPNPASGYINISGTEKISKYEIMNISGQLIMKENPGLNEFSLDVSNLPRGYITSGHIWRIRLRIKIHNKVTISNLGFIKEISPLIFPS